MNIHLRTFNILLMTLLLNSSCGELVESCSEESREKEEMCGKYCYKVIKPLLSYAASVRSKEEQFEEMQNKIRDQQVTILKYEYQCSLNNDKEKQLLDLREKIHNNEESNKQQQASLDTIKNLVKDLNNKIYNQDATIIKPQQQNDAMLGKIQDKIHDHEVTIKELNNANKQKQEQVETMAKLQQQCTSNDAMVRELQDKIQNQAETIENLESAIKQNKDQAAIVAKLQQQNESLSEQIVKLKSEVNAKDEEIEDKNVQLNATVSEIKTKNTQIAGYTAKVIELESQLSKMQSTSVSSNCLGKSTDVHMLNLPNIGVFPAPCDSKLTDFGWTVIQRRVNGSVDFYRNWNEYKEGFGDLHGEFFLGLEKLHALTQFEPHELYIYLENYDIETHYARYSHFLIGDETESYKLKMVGKYSGTAGDSLTKHINMKFSTKDQDNDIYKGNCADGYESGWWYHACYESDLNGRYVRENRGSFQKIAWNTWLEKPIKSVQMMIRPKSQLS